MGCHLQENTPLLISQNATLSNSNFESLLKKNMNGQLSTKKKTISKAYMN